MRRDYILLVSGVCLLLVSAVVVAESVRWIGRPFLGFLVLENRVVASAGLSHWSATENGKIYQQEIVSVDGEPLRDVMELHAKADQWPVGTPIRYHFRRGDQSFERVLPTRVFTRFDYTLLFGTMLLNGLAFAGVAMLIRFLRGGDRLAAGSFPALFIAGIWGLSAMDLYGPYRLFRLHALCETLLFATTLHMSLVFPHPTRLVKRHPRIVWLPYLGALPLAIANQVGLFHPPAYRLTHMLAVTVWGVSLAVFISTQIRWYLRPPTFEARQRVKVVVFGSVAALSPGAIIALGSVFTGGEMPQNAMAFTVIFYPIAIGYAVLRQDLLEVDLFLRRSLGYAILTAIATLTYVAVAQGVGLFSQRSTQAWTSSFGFAFSLVCVVLILLLRDRVQTWIDRVFFRSAYDFRRIVARASARLASVADLSIIADELTRAAGEALHPAHLKLLVRCGPDSGFQVVHRSGDAAEDLDDDEELERARVATGLVDDQKGGLCVPFRADGRLVAALSLGRPLSGRLYGGDDRGLLRTLANQGAVAIENALRLERLRELNRSLELKVSDRTRELREAQAQLVHREKMASLGQFVAGIAHEINNPLNFIQGNLFCLREYVGTMTDAVARYERLAIEVDASQRKAVNSLRAELDLDLILQDLESTFEGCAEGIERTSTLVRDLRTFSRLDRPDLMPADLHEAIDSTLNLLRSKLNGIEVNKEFGDIPKVECLAGQMNQVFMNLIANAADALDGSGTITIRSRCLPPDRVAFEIEDDGCGIEAEDLERIFDPFFSTKGVGKGTGLGLAISYGIVSRHSGTIRVQSSIHEGTCFRVELPLRASKVVSADECQRSQKAERIE